MNSIPDVVEKLGDIRRDVESAANFAHSTFVPLEECIKDAATEITTQLKEMKEQGDIASYTVNERVEKSTVDVTVQLQPAVEFIEIDIKIDIKLVK